MIDASKGIIPVIQCASCWTHQNFDREEGESAEAMEAFIADNAPFDGWKEIDHEWYCEDCAAEILHARRTDEP